MIGEGSNSAGPYVANMIMGWLDPVLNHLPLVPVFSVNIFLKEKVKNAVSICHTVADDGEVGEPGEDLWLGLVVTKSSTIQTLSVWISTRDLPWPEMSKIAFGQFSCRNTGFKTSISYHKEISPLRAYIHLHTYLLSSGLHLFLR